MSLNLDQTEFVSKVQKALWMEGRQVVPFEISTAEITDPEMLEGLQQVFNCINDHYIAAFENTEAYRVTIIDKLERDYKNSVYDACDMSQANAILNFFWRLSENLVGDEWVVNITEKNKNDFGMLDLLKNVGIQYENNGTTIKIKNIKYPLFTKYYTLFIKACGQKNVYVNHYVSRLDFRVFNKRYSKSPNETLRIVPLYERKLVMELYDYVISKGAKPKASGNSHNGISLLYNKQGVMSIACDGSIGITLTTAHAVGERETNSRDLFFGELVNPTGKHEIYAFILGNTGRCHVCNGNAGCGARHDTNVEGDNRHRCLRSFGINTEKSEKYGYENYIAIIKQIIDLRIKSLDNVANVPVVEKASLSKEDKQAQFDEAVKNMIPRSAAVDIDLAKMSARGEVGLTLIDGQLVVTNNSKKKGVGKNDINNSAESSEVFSGPIKIELRVKTSGMDIWTFYNKGSLGLSLKTKAYKSFDPATGQLKYHSPPWKFPVNEFVDVEWYIAQDFMAIMVNGELWHYDEDSDYINKFAEKMPPPAPVCVSTIASRTKVTVERLRVTEI